MLSGGILVALAWTLNSLASSLPVLYLAAAVGGIGTGSVYGTCVGNALKWFPRRRGLAAGITASGFGAGAALTIVPISNMIDSSGYERAFLSFGLFQGGVVFVIALLLLAPPAQLASAKVKPDQTAHGYTPGQVLRSPVFYVLYLMFVLVAAGGLTMAASMGPIAKDFRIDEVPVDLFGFTMAALVFALSLNRVLDGAGRPFFGWLSDRIGREHTMALAFFIGAAALYTLSQSGSNPVVFVLVTALYFGVYGEIFSVFSRDSGRYLRLQVRSFQRRHAVHRQGCGRAPRSRRGRFLEGSRLGAGIHHCVDVQRRCGAARAVRAQTDADAALREGLRGVSAGARCCREHTSDAGRDCLAKALDGIRILDFTHVQSGPTCTQLLAWFGADVIKVEKAGTGDITREQLRDIPDVDSLYFTMLNHNKRSVTLDTKSELGKQVAREAGQALRCVGGELRARRSRPHGFHVGADSTAQPAHDRRIGEGLWAGPL